MRKLKRIFFLALYYYFTRHLPEHSMPRGMLFCRVREFSVAPLLRHAGKDLSINRGAHFGKGDKLSIDDESSLGINARVVGDITIGKYVGMAHDVFITASNRDFSNLDLPVTHQGLRPDDPVVISDDVFIGCNTVILPGVHIGTGNIIGAAAVIARDTPPWCIVAGNPAKVVKWRKIPPADFDFSRCIPLTEKVRRQWEEAHHQHAHASTQQEVMADIAG